MKKSILFSVLLSLAWTFTAQAVVIHWAASSTTTAFDSAALVYVTTGNQGNYGVIATHPTVGSIATDGAIVSGPGGGVYERVAVDSETRASGYYYVVLFNGGQAVSVSTAGLSTSDTSAIRPGFDPLDIAPGTFAPSEWSSGWTPIPEPTSMALFCFGAATMALRRRLKKRA